MPTLKAYINLTLNDAQVGGFPVLFEQVVDEVQQLLPIEIPADNNNTTFTVLGIGEIDTVQFLFVSALEALGLRIEGGEAGSVAIRLDAGGFLLAGKVSLTDTDIKTNNNSAVVATVVGLAGGT